MSQHSAPSMPSSTPQIALLTRAIEANPDAPVNYLLRGEELVMCGVLEQAQSDFEMVRLLAESLLRESEWGYIYQAYSDRAEVGLRRCGVEERL
ncbi:MAG: hypothetical protein JXQ72_15495 [Anaerolineae bacterium]|nr:hypothetical protein [Anaerolineae bacterium]